MMGIYFLLMVFINIIEKNYKIINYFYIDLIVYTGYLINKKMPSTSMELINRNLILFNI